MNRRGLFAIGAALIGAVALFFTRRPTMDDQHHPPPSPSPSPTPTPQPPKPIEEG